MKNVRIKMSDMCLSLENIFIRNDRERKKYEEVKKMYENLDSIDMNKVIQEKKRELTFEQLPKAISELYQKIENIEAILLKMSEPEEKLMSPEEARKIFSPVISRGTLHNWTAAGYIKKYHLGGRTWYKKSEILQSVKHLNKYNNDSRKD